MPPPLRSPYTPGGEGAGVVAHSERFSVGLRVWLRGDLLIDTAGGSVLAAVLEGIAPGGRAVLIGYTGEVLETSLPHFLQRGVSLLLLNMFRREHPNIGSFM